MSFNTVNGEKQIVRRHTNQRDIILQAISEGNHPSAREIFDAVSLKKRMSFGTVYRNLQILNEEGEIICIESDPEALRYERRKERHHHLYCKKCRKVFDVPIPYKSEFDIETARKSGFVIESHSISFEGLCKDCAASV